MTLLELANLYIPGYQLLSPEEREKFENSDIGKKFFSIIKSYFDQEEFLKQYDSKSEVQKSLARKQQEDKIKLESLFKDNMDYELFIHEIHLKIITTIYPDIHLLSPAQQLLLIQTNYSQQFIKSFLEIQEQLYKMQKTHEALFFPWKIFQQNSGLQKKLDNELQQAQGHWYQAFSQETNQMRETVFLKKAKKRAQELATLLPLLNQQISLSNKTFVEQLIEQYYAEYTKNRLKPHEIDEAFLTTVFIDYFENNVPNFLNQYLPMEFKHQQAQNLAKTILQAFDNKKTVDIEKWLAHYNNELLKALLDNVLLINDQNWQQKNISPLEENHNSLSYLFMHSKAMNKFNEFFTKIADAHAFIQATGFSTQNESSFMAILDIYNYGRFSDDIQENKAIFLGLFTPFLPLYQEYKEITRYEKNVYRKIFRVVMPILIIAAFIVALAALLSPLAIPELAFLVVLIPALYIGTALATHYVTLKNKFYQSFREWYYGGHFQIPEFQINERMAQTFSEQNAQQIRDFYISELSKCDELETFYMTQEVLSQEQIETRKHNLEKRCHLNMEWYDIHCNRELSREQIIKIVQQRLNQEITSEFKEIQNALEKRDKEQLQESIKPVVSDLKMVLTGEDLNLEVEDLDGDSMIRIVPVKASRYSPRLFSFLPHKERAESLHSMVEDINTYHQPNN